MRLALLLPLLIACNLEQQTCMDVPAWVLSDVGIEVDNMTCVAVVGRAEPIWGDENPAAVVVVYDGYDLETNSWTTVLASAVLDPDGEQEFVATRTRSGTGQGRTATTRCAPACSRLGPTTTRRPTWAASGTDRLLTLRALPPLTTPGAGGAHVPISTHARLAALVHGRPGTRQRPLGTSSALTRG